MLKAGLKLYSRVKDHETILECWGGSTKHPDSVFHFSDFRKSEGFENYTQIYQWLLECASKMTFPFHARDIVELAEDNYKATFDYERLRAEKLG